MTGEILIIDNRHIKPKMGKDDCIKLYRCLFKISYRIFVN